MRKINYQHIQSRGRYFLILSIALIVISLSFATTLYAKNADWNLILNVSGVKTWQLSTNKSVTGSLEVKNSQKNKDYKNISESNYYLEYKESKKKILRLIGITDWQADSYQWKRNNDHTALQVSGCYKDQSGAIITFLEIHLFYLSKTILMLHTRPQKTKKGQKLAGEIFQIMQKEASVEGG